MNQQPKLKGNVPVTPEEVMGLFGQLFNREIVQGLLQAVATEERLYWRILTPLIVMWGFVYQRLHEEHSCDAFLSHLHSGAADSLDDKDPHEAALSQRLKSESTSGYVQGRKRQPLALLDAAHRLVAQHAEEVAGKQGRWRGLAVRLIDGTTFLLPPEGDIVETYGRYQANGKGVSHWIKVVAVMAGDLFTQAVVGLAEGDIHRSESELAAEVFQQDSQENSLYIADHNFGIYRVVQAAQGTGKQVLLRLNNQRALALLKKQTDKRPLASGESRVVLWSPSYKDQTFDQWPATAIAGRLIYLRVVQDGFQPFDLYLFTTLLDEELYPTTALCELYLQRWQIEIRFRHAKTAMEMDFFNVQSTAMFRKELAAGLLTYNLICVLMTKAALRANLSPYQLSFKKCLRRVHQLLSTGVPAWVREQQSVADYILDRLARCRLPNQPNKVRHEPRAKRYKPRPYPALHGDRQAARDTSSASAFKIQKS